MSGADQGVVRQHLDILNGARRTPARKTSRPNTSNTPPRCSHPKHLARCTGRQSCARRSTGFAHGLLDLPLTILAIVAGDDIVAGRVTPAAPIWPARRRVLAPPTGRPLQRRNRVPLVEAGVRNPSLKVHVPVGRYHRRTASAGQPLPRRRPRARCEVIRYMFPLTAARTVRNDPESRPSPIAKATRSSSVDRRCP